MTTAAAASPERERDRLPTIAYRTVHATVPRLFYVEWQMGRNWVTTYGPASAAACREWLDSALRSKL